MALKLLPGHYFQSKATTAYRLPAQFVIQYRSTIRRDITYATQTSKKQKQSYDTPIEAQG
jgi:hypothetical protein